jgi:hypothetical protein
MKQIFLILLLLCAAATNAQVTIGAGTMPRATLDIIRHDASETGKAFMLEDGNQGEGKVLTSDANGMGTWKSTTTQQSTGVAPAADTSISNVSISKQGGLVSLHAVITYNGPDVIIGNAARSSLSNRVLATITDASLRPKNTVPCTVQVEGKSDVGAGYGDGLPGIINVNGDIFIVGNSAVENDTVLSAGDRFTFNVVYRAVD